MNLGFLGAVSGAGQGMADVAKMDLDEAKQVRLEEIRTRNARDTNTQNNQQRHDFSLKESEVKHGYNLDEQEQGNEYSLAQIAQQDKARLGQITEEYTQRAALPTDEQKNAGYWADPEGANIPLAEQYADNQARTATSQSSQIQNAEYLRKMGASDEVVQRAVTGEDPPSKIRADLEKDLGKDPYLTPEQVAERVDAAMYRIFPDLAPPPPAPADYQTMFDKLKEQNGDKFTPEQINQYLLQTYGVKPAK